MVKLAWSLGVTSLLLLLSPVVAEETPTDQPQLLYNASMHFPQTGALSTRELFGLDPRDNGCGAAYAQCAYNSNRCCPLGTSCCTNGYCADAGGTCCPGGTCAKGWNCCEGHCSPVGGECCNGGYYCNPGYHCRIWNGQKVCCPSSGCVGENDSGSLGGGAAAGPTVTATATAARTTSITSVYQPSVASLQWYTTTYYWTYWFYFWTSYTPYTVQTVTSTLTTTTTILTALETNLAAASSSFASSISTITAYPPVSATSLKSSTNPVPIRTAVPTTVSLPLSGGPPPNAARPLPLDTTVVLMWTILAVVCGGLALGL